MRFEGATSAVGRSRGETARARRLAPNDWPRFKATMLAYGLLSIGALVVGWYGLWGPQS